MKITSSTRKLDAWERTRELDRRALKHLEAGETLESAYRQALSKTRTVEVKDGNKKT